MDVTAVIVGDEILSGHVVDANGAHFARVMHEAGHRLRRIAVVADDIEAIARELRTVLADGCRLVVTSGGVGPTHDDVTLEGVAAGLERALVECGEMRARVDEWIARATTAGVTEEALGAAWLRRMALAPEGAALIACSSPIPAFRIQAGEAIVCVLPGPPSQFALALDAVLPLLEAATPPAVEEVEHGFPESMLAQVLADLTAAHPLVAIGSYPLSERTLLRIKGPLDDVRAVATSLQAAIARLAASEPGRAMAAALAARRARAVADPPG